MEKNSIILALLMKISDELELGEMVKDISVQVIKNRILLPMRSKILRFFKSEKETSAFIEKIVAEPVLLPDNPQEEVLRLYREYSALGNGEELYEALQKILKDNRGLLKEMAEESRKNKKDILCEQNVYAEKSYTFIAENINIGNNFG